MTTNGFSLSCSPFSWYWRASGLGRVDRDRHGGPRVDRPGAAHEGKA